MVIRRRYHRYLIRCLLRLVALPVAVLRAAPVQAAFLEPEVVRLVPVRVAVLLARLLALRLRPVLF